MLWKVKKLLQLFQQLQSNYIFLKINYIAVFKVLEHIGTVGAYWNIGTQKPKKRFSSDRFHFFLIIL